MYQRIAHIALVVESYDKAIAFYRDMLDFVVVEDTQMGDKRWVLIAPAGARESCLLLAKAANQAQSAIIGNQTAGRVFLFLYTDDFQRDYRKYTARGVEFIRPPRQEQYGTVAVFQDLYGNLWDLIQPSDSNKGLLKPAKIDGETGRI
ncbi:MAG: VOC family protein [Pedobacter sp.]|nr:MAG: VOC family protein [Pedobacter sp.]